VGAGSTSDHCTMHRHRFDCLVDFLRTQARPEELGGVSPEDVAMMLSGLGGAYLMEWLQEGDDRWIAEKFTQAIDVLLRGLARA
jgi:hypothetical protein